MRTPRICIHGTYVEMKLRLSFQGEDIELTAEGRGLKDVVSQREEWNWIG